MNKLSAFSFKKIVISAIFLTITVFLFAQETKDVKSGLCAQWTFEETTDTIIDAFNFSNGNIMDNHVQRVEGLMGNAIDFTESNDSGYIHIAHTDSIEFDSAQSFSISTLLKCDFINTTGEMYILVKGTYGTEGYPGASGKWFALSYKNVPANNVYRELRFSIDDNITKSQATYNLPVDFNESIWHHFVCVRDTGSKSLYLFVDGEQVATFSDLTEQSIASGLPLLMGNYYFSDCPYLGQMDDVRMYNTSMPADSITALYNYYGLANQIPSINDPKHDMQYFISCFPNPAKEMLNINVPADFIGEELQIFNLQGKLVYSQLISSGEQAINIHGYSQGIYLLRVNNLTGKVVIE